nr:RNA-dependent RNA polymerase [Marmot picobirnavirus]
MKTKFSPNDTDNLKNKLEAYLAEHKECTAAIVEPTGEIADILSGSDAIRGYLSGLTEGRAMTPRSWFGENEAPEALLSQVISIINSTKVNSPYADVIKQFTLDYTSKYGPQGGTPPIIDSVELILRGFYPNPVDYSDPLWKQAKQNLIKRLMLKKTLKPWSYQRVVDDKKFQGKLSRYAGFPTGGKKSNLENQQKAIKDAISGKCFEYPAMILFRYYKGKLRMVWMYPFAMTLKGAAFEAPLMKHLRGLNMLDFGMWEGFDVIKELLTKAWDPKTQVAFGGDTTAMDDHMQLPQNLEALDVIKYAFEERYWPELESIIRHENNIPLLLSSKVMLTGQHGKASGADFTQMTETIYQAIVQEWIALQQPAWKWWSGIGDDYVTGLNGLMKWAGIMTNYYNKMGLPSKIEKQSDEVGYFTFVQRLIVSGWKARGNSKILGGIYSIISALRSLVYPENWIDPEDYPGRFSDMFCTKVAMIVENTVDSPYFEPFVKWAAHKQKDIIPFAKKAKSELDHIWKLSKSVRGVGESYNQEKQDKPISSYACMAIWRKM